MAETVNLSTSKQRIRFSPPEIYLVIVLLIFGLAACFVLPVGAGYDEETHLIRVWEMSALTFLPNEKLGNEMPFPAVYWEMSYRRALIVRVVEPNFWEKYSDLSIEAHDYIYGDVETRSVYSPPLLFPQAMVMRYLGRSLQLPALTVFYICRIVGLLCYLVLVWFAVRVIPFGKWILAILAASPVAILQASTVSADTISNGIALLFIAATLAIAHKKEVHQREWGFLAFLVFILFWGKLNTVPLVILPFLLLKPYQFKTRFGYFALLLTTIGLFAFEALGWNLLAYSRLSTAIGRADPLGQIAFILSHPFDFIVILANHIWVTSFERFLDWIAIYGYNYWPVPSWTHYLFIAGLIAALFPKKHDETVDKKTRIALAIVFLIAYLVTILSMYVTFNPVGNKTIDGVQGRYYMTVMPLLFLTLACSPSFKRIQLPNLLPAAFGVASLTLYLIGMYLSYYIPCGSQYYQADLCYQPNYKNWAPDALYSPPVSDQMTLAQEIVPECNGMTELRVWVNAESADANETTRFILKDVSDGREVININVPNSELPFGNWYSLTFQPDWVSNGKFYLLTINTDHISAVGSKIAYSLKPEYPAGKLFENDKALSQDMVFQTGCIAGWKKLQQKDFP